MDKKIIFSFIVLSLLIGFASAHVGDDDFGHHMMGGMMTGTYGSMWVFGWLFMILIIIALILLIIWLIKQIQKK